MGWSVPEILLEMVEWGPIFTQYLSFKDFESIFFSTDATIFSKELKRIKIAHKKLPLWQLGVFFLCGPNSPKQPRTSFYKFFCSTISGRISGWCFAFYSPLPDLYIFISLLWMYSSHHGRKSILKLYPVLNS